MGSVHVLVGIGDVQKIVLLVVFLKKNTKKNYNEYVTLLLVSYLIERSHGSRCWWNYVINEEKQCIFWPQVDPLAD